MWTKVAGWRGPAFFLAMAGGLAGCDDGPTEPGVGEEAWTQVAAGSAHACALRGSGEVWCWGASAAGQAGERTQSLTSPALLSTDLSFRALAAGGDNTCAITDDDRLFCWGSNSLGQLGDGRALDSPSPVEVAGDHRWRSVSVGTYHVCGIDEQNRILCWGGDRWDVALGYLAGGTCSQIPEGFQEPSWPCSGTPRAMEFGGVWDWVEAGLYQTCAGREGEGGRCWGTNRLGQLGTTAADTCPGPDPLHPTSRPCARSPILPDGPAMATIRPGSTHACGLTPSGGPRCWGAVGLHFGQIGSGSGDGSAEPVPPAGLGTLAAVRTSAASTILTFSCGIDTAGTAFCWGANRHGQVGTSRADRCGPSSAICAPVPEEVVGGHSFQDLTLGSEFSCGLTQDGRILCWGQNGLGQLGDGTSTSRHQPMPVAF